MCTNDMDRLGEFSAPIPLILFCHFPARRSDSLARTLRTTRAWPAYVPQRPRQHIHPCRPRTRRNEEKRDHGAHHQIPPHLQSGQVLGVVGEEADHAFLPDLHHGEGAKASAQHRSNDRATALALCKEDAKESNEATCCRGQPDDLQGVHDDILRIYVAIATTLDNAM